MAASPWLVGGSVGGSIAVVGLVVYLSGGTQYVLPHLFYFAIAAAGLLLGRVAGVISGLAAGLIVGPWMPLDVANSEPQPTSGWLLRAGMFVGIGVLAGWARMRFLRLLERRLGYFASLSHQLRTPLSAVLGYAQILEDQWPDIGEGERSVMVGEIYRGGLEVAHVLDNLLVANRLEFGPFQLNCDLVRLDAVVRSVVDIASPRSNHQIEMVGEAEAWVDPVRFRQICVNLLDNALAYGGDLVVAEVGVASDRGYLCIRDNGPGLPEGKRPGRVGGSVEDDPSGTSPQALGLGLAVCDELARRLGGSLTYDRCEGWSSFVVDLPLASRSVGSAV